MNSEIVFLFFSLTNDVDTKGILFLETIHVTCDDSVIWNASVVMLGLFLHNMITLCFVIIIRDMINTICAVYIRKLMISLPIFAV